MSREDAGTQLLVRDGDRLTVRTRRIVLEIIAGPDAPKELSFAGPSVAIGTREACEVKLTDPAVSRHHATRRIEEGNVRVVGEESRNGTIVDGMRVKDTYVRPDSTIVIGK